jgi:hypothetical protein
MQLQRFDRGRKNLGHRFFAAPNPPAGAIISYFVSGGLEARIEILDGEGKLLRQLPAPSPAQGARVERVVWDLRHPLPYEPNLGVGGETKTGTSFNVPYGPFVMPGEYQVRLTVGNQQRVQKVQVKADPAIPLADADRRRWHDTLLGLTRLQATVRAVLATAERAEGELRAASAALSQAPAAPPPLVVDLKAASTEASAIATEARPEPGLFGGTMAARFRVVDHINMLYAYIEGSTALPTRDQERLIKESTGKLNDLVSRLRRLVGETLPSLYRRLDEQGVPWTPGRSISLPSEIRTPNMPE